MDKNMVTARVEDLSRDQILNSLQKRHLHINEMHSLTHDELLRVYKTFILPMSRRPQRYKHFVHHQGDHRFAPNNEDNQMPMAKESDFERMSVDIDLPSETNGYTGNNKVASSIIFNPVAEKRRPTCDALTEDYQHHLSKATKRIRIDAFF